LWLHSLKVTQLLRSAACLHTNQSWSYLNHLVFSCFDTYVYITYKRKREKELWKKYVHSHLRKNKIRCKSTRRFILNRVAERKGDEKQHKNSIKRSALFNGFKVDSNVFVIQNCHINKET